MKTRIAFRFVSLAYCLSLPLSAQAQTAGIENFNPVPTTIQLDSEKRAAIIDEVRNFMASVEHVAPSEVQLGATTMWSKATGDGFIACVVMPPQGGRQLSYVAAISASNGPFGGAVLRKIWDNATYSQFGCGTPGGIKLL